MQMAFSPILAEIDIPEIIAVVVAFLYGLFWLFKKLAEGKEEQRRIAERGRARGAEEEEDDESYIADEQQVRSFLDTLGVEPEPPHQPQPTHPPMPPPAQPGRPPQRQPQGLLRAEPEPLLLEPPPPSAAQPEQPEEAYVFGAGPIAPAPGVKRLLADTEQEPARKTMSPAERLAFPQLAPLQRAIILSDILGHRPGPHRHGRR